MQICSSTCSSHGLRAGSFEQLARLRATDPGDPRRIDARCPRRTSDPRGTEAESELDRGRWLYTTYQAANELVAKFVDIGVLTEITGQSRNRRFMYRGYINLFHEDQAETEE